MDALHRIDDEVAEVEAALEANSAPPAKGFELTPLRVIGLLLAAMWAGSLFAD